MIVKDPQRDFPLDWLLKGVPMNLIGHCADEIVEQNRTLFDGQMFFPVAVLREATVHANRAWMRAFLDQTGAKIAPHGKTTMAPDLFRLQIEDGAWAITAATTHHVRAYRQFGVNRILLANQLIGRGEIEWIISELQSDSDFEFYCLVDSLDGLKALADGGAGGKLERPINVLIETGPTGGRAGVRSLEEGVLLAEACRNVPGIRLRGVETFEGVVQMLPDPEPKASMALNQAYELAKALDQRGLFSDRVLITGGGSAFFDLVAGKFSQLKLSRPVDVVIRSGCYLIHDHGMYARLFDQLMRRIPEVDQPSGGLQPALEIWGIVQAHPEPGRWICTLGRRDMAFEAPPPKLIGWYSRDHKRKMPAPPEYSVTGLFDQHLLLDGPPDAPFHIGDYIGFGVSHPCTTFDKWKGIYWVDDDYKITGLVRTYF